MCMQHTIYQLFLVITELSGGSDAFWTFLKDNSAHIN